MFCGKCGSNNPNNAMHCRNCGAKLMRGNSTKTLSISAQKRNRKIGLVILFIVIFCVILLSGIFYMLSKSSWKSGIPEGALEANGHFYYVYDLDSITSWESAKKYCEEQGGYLATITSPEENESVYSYLRNHTNYESAYFGLTDRRNEGTWAWDNGEVSSYTNWHSGEPNNENPNEDFAMFYGKYSDGSWNDGDFGNLTVNSGTAFICEWGNYTIPSPLSISSSDPKEVLEIYLKSAAKTFESGSWSERAVFDANLSAICDGVSFNTMFSLRTDSSITNYKKSNPSQAKISSLSEMTFMDEHYIWATEYEDGTAVYEFKQPNQGYRAVKINPNFITLPSLPEDSVLAGSISENQIHFTLSADKISEIALSVMKNIWNQDVSGTEIAALEEIDGVDNLKYSDMEVDVLLHDNGKIDSIEIGYTATFNLQNYDAAVDYQVYYSIS